MLTKWAFPHQSSEEVCRISAHLFRAVLCYDVTPSPALSSKPGSQRAADRTTPLSNEGLTHEDSSALLSRGLAPKHGVSLNLTKSDVIEMLDALEPHIDHYNYSGKTPIAAKQKHGIPPLKNKEQLVKALEKVAGQQLAEKARRSELRGRYDASVVGALLYAPPRPSCCVAGAILLR